MARLFFILPLTVMLACQSTPTGEGRQSGPPVFYSESHLPFAKWRRDTDCCAATGKEVAIASGGTHSSKIGLEILNEGGNVVDAAVAVSLALAVERPQSLGIGGGGFMTLHMADETPTDYFVDFRETAPARATRDMFLDKQGKVISDKSTEGGLAVGTPGMIAGMYDIHKKWGRLPWRKLVEPAVRLAKEGFPAYLSLAERTDREKSWIEKDSEARKILHPSGRPLAVGEIFRQPDLARTLQAIARGGKTAFYSGRIAGLIAKTVKKSGGILDERDLKSYRVEYRDPVKGKFRDFTLTSAPPPSAGGVLLAQMLGVLDGFELEKEAQSTDGYLHLLSEVMKRAYADRADHIGDPKFGNQQVTSLYAPEYIEQLRRKVDKEKSTPSASIRPATLPKVDIHGTSHFSIIDSEGNAVAGTLTINDSFGANVVVPGTGIFLNNEMDDFSVKAGEPNIYGLTGSEANAIAPGKRPVSSMSPTILFSAGRPVLAVGGAGGSRIISSVLQTILGATVVYPRDLKKAVFAARAHHQWLPDRLDLESGFPDEVSAALKRRGHDIAPWPFVANVFAVQRDPTGVLTAVFDPRDEGGAVAQ